MGNRNDAASKNILGNNVLLILATVWARYTYECDGLSTSFWSYSVAGVKAIIFLLSELSKSFGFLLLFRGVISP